MALYLPNKPMDMNQMMGLMMGLKRRMLPESGKPGGGGAPIGGGGGRLVGDIYGKSGEAPMGSGTGTGIEAAGPPTARWRGQPGFDEYGRPLGESLGMQIEELQSQLVRLTGELNKPPAPWSNPDADNARKAQLRVQIRLIEEKIAELKAKAKELEAEHKSEEERIREEQRQQRGGMGTSSTGGNYGGMSAEQRRLMRERERAAGRPWYITSR